MHRADCRKVIRLYFLFIVPKLCVVTLWAPAPAVCFHRSIIMLNVQGILRARRMGRAIAKPIDLKRFTAMLKQHSVNGVVGVGVLESESGS
jgi:hypothetical protein